MGAVVFVSLPLLLLCVLVGACSYYYGRQKGIDEGRTMAALELGVQLPPASPIPEYNGMMGQAPPASVPPPQPYYPPPPTNYNGNMQPAYLKQDQSTATH